MEEIDVMYKKTDLMLQNWTLTLKQAQEQEAGHDRRKRGRP